MDTSLAGSSGAVQNDQPENAAHTWVVSRSLSLLAILAGLYISWFYEPSIYYGSGSLWLVNAGAILVFGGVLAWAGLELISRKYEGHRFHPLASIAIIFLIGMLLNVMARLLIYLFDPPHWPELNITYAAFNFPTSLIYGASGICAYAVMFRHMHKLTLKNAPLYLLFWHVLTGLVLAAFICLAYGIRLDLSMLRFELISPFTSGVTAAIAQLVFISGSLLGAWWLARNVLPANASPRQTRGTWLGDLVFDFIDNRLSLGPTFWYIGMIGGHLVTLPLLILATMNASPIAALIVLVPLILFWAMVFLRVIKTSERYPGSSFWVVCAVIIVGSQMIGNLVGAVLISRMLLS